MFYLCRPTLVILVSNSVRCNKHNINSSSPPLTTWPLGWGSQKLFLEPPVLSLRVPCSGLWSYHLNLEHLSEVGRHSATIRQRSRFLHLLAHSGNLPRNHNSPYAPYSFDTKVKFSSLSESSLEPWSSLTHHLSPCTHFITVPTSVLYSGFCCSPCTRTRPPTIDSSPPPSFPPSPPPPPA